MFYVLFTAAVFSMLEPMSKLLAGSINALALTFWRFLIGSAVLLPVALVKLKKARLCLTGRQLLAFGGQGVLCVCLSMVSLQLAVFQAHSAALIAVIFCTNSVLSVLLAAWLLREALTPRKLVAVALCMAGVAVGGAGGGGESLTAVALALCAAVSMSLFTVLGKKLMRGVPPEVQIGLSFPVGTAALGMVLLLARVPIAPASWDARTIGVILTLGVVVTGLGYWSYFKAMERAGASMAAMVFFIKPVLAPLASLLFLGSATLNGTFFATLLLVALGSALILWRGKARVAPARDTERMN